MIFVSYLHKQSISSSEDDNKIETSSYFDENEDDASDKESAVDIYNHEDITLKTS